MLLVQGSVGHVQLTERSRVVVELPECAQGVLMIAEFRKGYAFGLRVPIFVFLGGIPQYFDLQRKRDVLYQMLKHSARSSWPHL